MKDKTKKKSLTVKVTWMTLISAVLPGLAALIIGLSVLYTSLVQQYINRACETALNAARIAINATDSVDFSKDVMTVYRSLTPEQKSKLDTEEYRNYFNQLESVTQIGAAHDVLIHALRNVQIDVAHLYLGMFDDENGVFVCFADTDRDAPMYPGEYRRVSSALIGKFMHWNGESPLYLITHPNHLTWQCVAGAPLYGESDEICAYIITEVSINDVMEDMDQFALRISIAVLFITLLVAWLSAWRIKRTVTDPINTIANTAATYVEDRKKGTARSDHFSSLGISTGDELENLVDVMDGMESDLIEHEKNLEKITAEEERMNTELSMARHIQAASLPSVFPPFPDQAEFDLYASMTPAKEVGGDFYDFFLIDEDHLALTIADVSGKGVPAALFMMVSKSLIKNQLLSGCTPEQALERTNLQLAEGNSSMTFVTVWLAVVELATGKATVCNAGHEHPCLKKAGGAFEMIKYKHDIIVGVKKQARYRAHAFTLQPGDCLFVYTDGVTEANNSSMELFGEARLLEVLNQDQDAEAKALINRVHLAVNRFAGGAPQFDDITMLCFKYFGPASTRP